MSVKVPPVSTPIRSIVTCDPDEGLCRRLVESGKPRRNAKIHDAVHSGNGVELGSSTRL